LARLGKSPQPPLKGEYYLRTSSNSCRRNGWGDVTKEDLVELIRKILRADQKLNFLMKLDSGDLKTLAACIRNGLEPKKK
jgi:hypothetical protein